MGTHNQYLNSHPKVLVLTLRNVQNGKKYCTIERCMCFVEYSEVPNRRADRNKQAGLEKSATLLAYLLSKLINEQGGIFRFTK